MALPTIDHPWIDNSLAPIYICTPPKIIDDETLQALLDAQTKFFHSSTHPYAFVLMVEHTTGFSAKQRATVAAMEKSVRAIEARRNKGQAYVLKNAFGRGLLQALQWLSPPVYPYKVVATRAEAINWASRQLGIEVPAMAS